MDFQFFFSSDQFMSAQDHKPNYTIPNQYIFDPFLGLFDLYFGQKYQKVNGFDLATLIP